MRKILFTCFVVITFGFGAFAQKIVKFNLPQPATSINNSEYNSFRFLDSRGDTTNIGFVQLGAFNRKAKVVAGSPLSMQFAKIFEASISTDAKNNGLLLQIRQFSFAEVTGSFSEKGYCYLRAELYAGKADPYQKLASLDTVVCLKSSIDVTDTILKRGGEVIAAFVTANLQKQAAGTSYNYADIAGIDNYEKQKLKLFTTTTYQDGLYFTY